jgi:hypothetical protein
MIVDPFAVDIKPSALLALDLFFYTVSSPAFTSRSLQLLDSSSRSECLLNPRLL